MNSLVSICIPSYNAEKYIAKCINSILVQSYKNFEIVVVDDASTDDTAKIVKSFNDNRIKYFLNDVNLGWRKNVKRCYELAKSEFVTMCPVDDFLSNTFIENAIKIFSLYPNVGIWSCGSITIDEDGNNICRNKLPIYGLVFSKEYFKYIYSMKYIPAPPETMIRKKVLDRVNAADCYEDIYNQFPEINLYLKILELGYDSFLEPQELCLRTSRKDSITGRFGNAPFIMMDYYNILKQYSKSEYVNAELQVVTNQHLFIKCVRLVKGYLKNFRIHSIYQIVKIFLNNDLVIKEGGYLKRLLRINEFGAMLSIHLFLKKY